MLGRASSSLGQISKVPIPHYNSKVKSRMPKIKQIKVKNEQSSSKGILG